MTMHLAPLDGRATQPRRTQVAGAASPMLQGNRVADAPCPRVTRRIATAQERLRLDEELPAPGHDLRLGQALLPVGPIAGVVAVDEGN